MIRHLSIDLETFSSVDLKKSGLYKYVESPDFQILLFAYSLDDSPVRCIDLAQGEPIPMEILRALYDPQIIKHAYNAPFEWYCLNKFYPAPLEQFRCTMMHGLYCGYTAGLGPTGEAMGLPQDKRKLGTGMSLIRTFCIPQTPSKTNGMRIRTLPHHEPDKWQLFKQYCVNDVVAEMEILRRLSYFPVPEQEQRLWELDQKINSFGTALDAELVDAALAIDERMKLELTEEALILSGITSTRSVQQMKKWLQEEIGEEVENLQATTVNKLIDRLDVGRAKRVLEIRQLLGKTSTKKYASMQAAVCEDGRIRGAFQFYGANRSGRWAGRLYQPHNLPKNHMESLGYARELVRSNKVNHIQIIYGGIPGVLSQLLRTALIPSLGNRLLVADFSAIEARVVAWLAGEQWRLDVFNSHGKIYEASASQMFGVPLEQIGKGSDLRQKGKVAELALGYQGSSGALIKMGALEMGLTEEELPDIVMRWRNANRRIVDLWYGFEAAALEVMRGGYPVGIRGLLFARESHYATQQDFFTVQLPSGRKLYYPQPHLSQNDFGKEALHYYEQAGKGWLPTGTYGGKICENICQAIARDCLAVALVRLDAMGYPITLHVHDEIVADVPLGFGSVAEMTAVMSQPIDWAPNLPLAAAGFATTFYMKD
ncbi:MAG: DNA polymerase [Paenibacillaceae bacterium]